ncbi:bifunctional metallophosphatase/5'-nucleotidase [bacterium]|nr:bifunctional metallophosphatase/5'-nucleotidase [bacterium]MBU1983187.1 bifunctional metallophosphatase/5'-nucleotidase [bacterium]
MRRWILAGLVMCCGLGCRSKPQDITIFHTNDIHGHFAAEPIERQGQTPAVGGMSALGWYLDSLRQLHPNSLYLDAGDLVTGNPVCNMEFDGVEGGALLEMLDRCKLDAMTLGNHEFDLGADHLRRFVRASPFPILCSNLYERSADSLLGSPSQVFKVGLTRVGVIGVLMDALAGSVSKSAMEPFRVADAAMSAQEQIDRLDAETDLLILLTHIGVEGDSILATRIRNADVIVGGHSHTRIESPRVVNNVLIVQAGSYCKELGQLDLEVANDAIVKYDGRLIPLVESNAARQTFVGLFADSIMQAIRRQYGQVIGDLGQSWATSYHTGSNVGNWVCDRLRERYSSDVAFVNAGGIRADLPGGPITMLDVLEMLPFTNAVVTFSVKGSELLKTAGEQIRAQALHAHGALEMSGMTISYSSRIDGPELRNVRIGGHPLEASRTYRVVTIDYVAFAQWNRYLGFEPHDVEITGEQISTVIGEEIRRAPQPIVADNAPRLKEVQ